jgi:hypothetical protein
MYNGMVKHVRLFVDEGRIVTTHGDFIEHSSREFFQNRIDVVRKAEAPLVAKIHQERLVKYPDLLKETIASFDHVILVERRDLFNQLLSQAISIHLNWYIPGQRMEEHKVALAANPILIDVAHWRHRIEEYQQNRNIDLGNPHHVFVEDLFAANAQKFCQLVGLPVKPFNLQKNTIEFGDKAKFVMNFTQLKEIFDEANLNHGTAR